MGIRRVLLACFLAAFGLIGLVAPPPAAAATPSWAPAPSAAVHPGVQTITSGGQCTANFVFYNGPGDIYIGQAAHCAGTGAATDTNGCTAGTLPVGTAVTVKGAQYPGTMAYSSWVTMQQLKETNADACAFNDLALVKLDPRDYGRVNPSIPVWGGPVGTSPSSTAIGDTVYSYGNSSLRLGITLVSPKRGVSIGDDGNGWSHGVYTATPGIPGDSGSAFLDGRGRALGVLSTIAILPIPASNNIGDVGKEVQYMNAHFDAGMVVAAGTEAFKPNALPIG
jgi:hypothetical protein